MIAYADRHGHWELLDRAAVCSLDCAVVEARKALSITSFAAWVCHLSNLLIGILYIELISPPRWNTEMPI